MANFLDVALSAYNIKCAACPRELVRGNDAEVRVFAVEHIKGLEFEAVFFVGIDRLAERHPDLFEKFLYVGATRAATFLGITSETPRLPDTLAKLQPTFVNRWSSDTVNAPLTP